MKDILEKMIYATASCAMLVAVVFTLSSSGLAQNHNPEFKVSDMFLGGEPYIFIGDNDEEVYPHRTPVELKYRDKAPAGGRTGTTTLTWSSGGDKVYSYNFKPEDGENGDTGVIDSNGQGTGERDGGTDGKWTWTGDAEQQNYDGKMIYLQGKTSASSGQTATLKSWYSKDSNQTEDFAFQKDFTLLKMDIVGYLPGPNGQRVSGVDEDNPDKLIVPVNDNFDERQRSNGSLNADNSNDTIDLSKDQDYIRLNLQFSEGVNDGILELVVRRSNGSETAAPLDGGLKFYSEDGQNLLNQQYDLTVVLSNTSSADPLHGINTAAGVTILAEGQYWEEDYTLALKYTNGSTTAYDELHMHIVDVDFADTSDAGALDDDDESTSVPHRWAMMVPLSAGNESSGSGKVQISVSPSSVASKVQLDWASGANAPSSFGPHTLTSANETLTIDGTSRAIGKALEVKWEPNSQVIDGLNVDFMPRRPKDTAQNVKVALWEITAHGGSTPSQPYNQQDILSFLEDSWTDGANVYFEVVQDWTPQTIDYDLDGSDSLTQQGNQAEGNVIRITANNSSADINVYLVENYPSGLAAHHPDSGGAIYIAENNSAGRASALSELAQEVGHALGIPESDDDDKDSGNVMSDPQVTGSTQIRKNDWRVVNP